MEINLEILKVFESQLDPSDLSASRIKAELIGYGEISAIFKLENIPYALKRLPLFSSSKQAEEYLTLHNEYCTLLIKSGLTLPQWKGYIVEVPGRPVSLYIAQEILMPETFIHRILGENKDKDLQIIEEVIAEIEKVWKYNNTQGLKESIELAIDGQLSNWALLNGKYYYIDTSTPLLRRKNIEQLNPDLILQSAPSFLKWLLKLFFLDDVLNRYYSPSLVYTDIISNLYKEKHPELIPQTIRIANTYIRNEKEKLTERKIEKYYREDKMIWSLFLTFRKIDRFLKTKILKKKYEFILPGKINR